MRFALLVLCTIVVAFLAHQIMPWYALVLSALLMGMAFGVAPGKSFVAGFLAGILLWGGYAWYLDMLNEGLLSGRMGQLFGGLSGGVMVLITAVLAGLFGGIGSLTGAVGRKTWQGGATRS